MGFLSRKDEPRTGQWSPIEIAPTDGTVVRISGGTAYFREGRWISLTGTEEFGREVTFIVEHWMPPLEVSLDTELAEHRKSLLEAEHKARESGEEHFQRGYYKGYKDGFESEAAPEKPPLRSARPVMGITNLKELIEVFLGSEPYLVGSTFFGHEFLKLFNQYHDWLSEQGFALVPSMPTDAMIKAGHEVPDEPECAEPALMFLSAANEAGNILTKTEDQE